MSQINDNTENALSGPCSCGSGWDEGECNGGFCGGATLRDLIESAGLTPPADTVPVWTHRRLRKYYVPVDGPIPDGFIRVGVHFGPVGEEERILLESGVTRVFRDALEISVTRDGRIDHRRLPKWYSRLEIPKRLRGHDICGWCGYDNGPNGELRQGHDCGFCGGN